MEKFRTSLKYHNIYQESNLAKDFFPNEAEAIFAQILSSRYFIPCRSSLIIVIFHLLLATPILGIILEYELRDKTRELKEIDLLHLTPE
jgi:hypothetical protein